jgi:hypothetical protein
MIKRILCLLLSNHKRYIISYEEGNGREFRRVKSCWCGKTHKKTHWLHDNDLLGHGK